MHVPLDVKFNSQVFLFCDTWELPTFSLLFFSWTVHIAQYAMWEAILVVLSSACVKSAV